VTHRVGRIFTYTAS